MNAWQGSVSDLQGQIESLNGQIEKAVMWQGPTEGSKPGEPKGAAAAEDAEKMRQEMDRLKDSMGALDKAADEVSDSSEKSCSSRRS